MSTHQVVSRGIFYKGVTTNLRSPTQQSGQLVYTPGTDVRAASFDPNPYNSCGQGINFCRTLTGALRWAKGGTVVELSVPEGALIVDAGDKMRASVVHVERVLPDLSRADLYGADLYGANLSGSDLSGSDLRHANLSGADLSRADLYGANLSRADLSGANLTAANLYGANLYGAYLTRADLSGANLSGAYLSEADLYVADLSRADLSGANLYGATLKYANLHGVSLVEARYDRWTRWPDAFNVTQSGARLV